MSFKNNPRARDVVALFTAHLWLAFTLAGCGPSLVELVKEDRFQELQEKIDKGADLDKKDGSHTALSYAAKTGKTEIVEMLLRYEQNVNIRHVYRVVEERVEDYETPSSGPFRPGWRIYHHEIEGTPLTSAIFYGHIEIADLLLDHGADIETRDYDGKTPLILAAERGSLPLVRHLVEMGAYIDAQDQRGDTALIVASRYGKMGIVKYLDSSGADVHVGDNSKSTALMIASLHGHADIARELIYGAENRGFYGASNVNAKNSSGNTSLILASSKGYSEVVKLLLGAGADVSAKNNKGITALAAARSEGHSKVVVLLEQAGATE